MIQRLLVTGAGGFVGGSLIAQAPDWWDIHALDCRGALAKRPRLTWHLVDLLDSDSLARLFHEICPSAVIHAAAAADIDFCESNRDVAEKVNVGVTAQLASLCAETKTKLVYLSTDTVFDGEKGNYVEEERPHPINYYAETKTAAEKAVRENCENWVIARLSLVVGLPLVGSGNSFLPKMLASLEAGKQVGAPGDEIRTPVDVLTLGRALIELAVGDLKGVFHLSGNDALPRYEMAQRIADTWGYPRELVVRKDSGSIQGRAPRPRDVSLNNGKARSLLKTPMLGLEEGLELIRAKNPEGATS